MEEVVIEADPDILAWIEENGLPSQTGHFRGRKFTETEDKIILAYWATSDKKELARKLGHAEGCVRSRYKELKEMSTKG